MKKTLFAVLCLMLCLCMALPALSEGTVVSMIASDVLVSKETGILAVRDKGTRLYNLFTAAGEQLTDGNYTGMSTKDYGFFRVEVASEDGVHDEGLIDSTGKVIIPPEYAEISVVSPRWQVGLKLTPCEADDKDYTFSNWSTGEKSFYRIDTADFFLDGEKVGSLPRSSYDGYPTARGAYIIVQNRERQRFAYDRTMAEGRPVETSSEYDSKYENRTYTYIHTGTGQVAFDPSCTLTPEEVDKSIQYDNLGQALDLQGNVLYKAKQNYDSVYAIDGSDCSRVRIYGKYGVIDREMNEIIPPEYDEIGYYGQALSRFGYISAVKDGKFGFVSSKGEVTCPFTYAKEIVTDRGTFATIKNLDGTIIVLSAAVGELPEHYQNVEFSSYNGAMAFIATNAAGEKGVVGLYGNTLVPFSADNRYISMSQDGTVVAVSKGSSNYDIWSFTEADLKPVAAAEEPTPEPAGEPAAADDGSWTCENGHEGNTGKFCSECGSPKPVVEDNGPWTCVNGHEGNTGKFCSECGSPKPAADSAPAGEQPLTGWQVIEGNTYYYDESGQAVTGWQTIDGKMYYFDSDGVMQ